MRERQLVAAVVVALGGVILGLTLRIEPGSPWFYPASLGLSAVWVVGAVVAGRPRFGPTRPVLLPIGVGAVLVGVFVLGGLVVRRISFLDDQAADIAVQAAQSSWVLLILVTAVTGIAEELFFRGTVYDAFPRHPLVVSTLAYAASTLAAGNVLLTFAAVLLGAVVALERQRWGGLLAPILTHLTWSLTMLFVLPALFDR